MISLTPLGLKITAVFLLLVPITLLFILAIGELVGGELPGLEHVLQSLPLIVLTYLAWKFPSKGGRIILSIAVLLGGLYIVYPPVGFPLQYHLINALLLFGPAAIAGLLFISASTENMVHK